MRTTFFRTARAICAVGLIAQGTAYAGVFSEGDLIMVQGAPGVYHFSPSEEHTKYSWLVGAEWQSAERWLGGYSYFNNSFGQKCHYIYGGKVWPFDSAERGFYFKLTGGVILGYKEPYEDKIPFNKNGVGPGVIPGVGYKYERFNVQANLLGNSALMITVGYDLLR